MLITALATPLDLEGKIDLKSYHQLLQHQKRGADGVLVAGTTGQGSLLSLQEKQLLLQATLDYPFTRGLCLSGARVEEVWQNMEIAARVGVDFVLVTPLFFIKPTLDAMVHFFHKILEESPAPVIVYNNPSRVGTMIPNGVYEALQGHKNLLGTKESAGKTSIQGIPIPVFTGDDEWIGTYAKEGAIGAISVLSNLFVETVKSLCCQEMLRSEELQRYTAFALPNPLMIQHLLYLAKIFQTNRVKSEIGFLTHEQQLRIEDVWNASASVF